MTANRNEAAVWPRQHAASERDIHQCFDRVDAVRVLGQPHRPDEDGIRPLDEQSGKRLDSIARHSAYELERAPFRGTRALPCSVETGRPLPYEVGVDAARFDQGAEHTDQEREVAAGM